MLFCCLHLLLVPLRPQMQLVVQQLHGFSPDRRQLVSHQPPHHRDERIRGQQGIHLLDTRWRSGGRNHKRYTDSNVLDSEQRTNLIQNIVGSVQQNPPELGGGFVGILLHTTSDAVDVPQDVLQQPETRTYTCSGSAHFNNDTRPTQQIWPTLSSTRPPTVSCSCQRLE